MGKWLVVGMLCTVFISGMAQEICDNGIDDNNNGLVDLADLECSCFDSAAVATNYVPDPSFEDTISCPSWYSEIYTLSYWRGGNMTSTDYFNSCGYSMPGLMAAGISATDGNGFVGGYFLGEWKEYFGTPLLMPLVPGNSYTFTLDVAMTGIEPLGDSCLLPPNLSPVKVSVFGTANYSDFPVTTNGCPTLQEADGVADGSANWVLLGDVLYTPSSLWNAIDISFVAPQAIKIIMIGPPCDLPPDYPQGDVPNWCSPYLSYDNIRVKEGGYIPLPAPQLQVSASGNCLGGDYTVMAEQVPGAVYRWTTPDQQEIIGNPLLIAGITGTQQGSYSVYYVVENCTSAVNSLLIYPPPVNPAGISVEKLNIITPNGDGVNDYLSGEDMAGSCVEYELIIWNRWGNEIFRQSNGQPPFEGKNTLGNQVPTGAYFYSLRVNDRYYKQALTVSY